MYRGYNGGLYSRGTRTNTNEAFPKFHQGDVVRTELDLDNGTIAYFVNDVPCGVAFKDIQGVIYPAVAFYGSGRSVTILRVEKIGICDAKNSCVYLYTLPEEEHTVGHGTIGKGCSLGYDKHKVN